MGGCEPGETQLPADVGLAFDERDGVAGGRGLERGGGAGGSAADHEHSSPGVARRQTRECSFSARTRVDRASDRHAGVVMADAGLIATHALDHGLGAAGGCLGDQLGVGDKGSGHPDEVTHAGGHDPLGIVEVDHARGGDQGQLGERAAEARRRLGDRVQRRGGWRGDPRRAAWERGVPERERNEVDQSRPVELAGYLDAVVEAQAAGHQLVARQAERRRSVRRAQLPGSRSTPRSRTVSARSSRTGRCGGC